MTRMKNPALRRFRPALALLCLPWLTACDAQVSTAYRGEALLTMTGKVEIQGDRTDGRLIPALAWVDYKHSQIDISEVEVEGEFPSNFTIHVYDPPSDAVLGPVGERDATVRGTAAYITAVTEKHPESIRFANSGSATAGASCTGGPCACPDGGCVSVDEVCTADGDSCYRVTTTCPRSDSPPEDCKVTHSGDADLAESPWKNFAGLSQNYAIVYLTEAVDKDSDIGWQLALSANLAKGYNLVELRELSDDELSEQADCERNATDEAVAYFNHELGDPAKTAEELGTLELKLMGLSCNPGCDPADPACEIPPECEPLDSDLVEAFPDKVDQLEREMGCLNPRANIRFTPVKDPAHESITVQIGPELRPIGGHVEMQMHSSGASDAMAVPTPAH